MRLLVSGNFSKTSLRVIRTFCGIPKDSLKLLISGVARFEEPDAFFAAKRRGGYDPSFDRRGAQWRISYGAQHDVLVRIEYLFFFRNALSANSE